MVLWEMNSDYADALRALLKQLQAMMRRQKNPSCGISTVLFAVSLLPSSFVYIDWVMLESLSEPNFFFFFNRLLSCSVSWLKFQPFT